MRRIVTLGETMGLFRSTESGRIGSRSHLNVGLGGAESNLAVALTRLGNDVTWAGRVGRDEVGRMIIRELRGEGITLHYSESDTPTGLMLKVSPLPGRQVVSYYRRGSAASELSEADLPEEAIATADALHITGITLAISESARATAFRAAEIARGNGTLVSFDVNHRSRLWENGEAASHYRSFAEISDIVLAGLQEASFVTGDDSANTTNVDRMLQVMASMGISCPVIKEGTEGSWTLINGTTHHQPAIAVDAVDTVGAGDGFAAGFLSSYLDDHSLRNCLEMGAKVGAFACLSYGDWEGYPTLQDLELLGEDEHVTR